MAGAGFSGAVLAEQLAKTGNFEITVFDRRKHVAGNCHTVRDPETQVMVHEYGPHIFSYQSRRCVDLYQSVRKIWGLYKSSQGDYGARPLHASY